MERTERAFKEFLDLCREVTDNDTVVVQLIQQRYNHTNPHFLWSQQFIDLIDRCSTDIRADPRNKYVHIKELTTELKVYTAKPLKHLFNQKGAMAGVSDVSKSVIGQTSAGVVISSNLIRSHGAEKHGGNGEAPAVRFIRGKGSQDLKNVVEITLAGKRSAENSSEESSSKRAKLESSESPCSEAEIKSTLIAENVSLTLAAEELKAMKLPAVEQLKEESRPSSNASSRYASPLLNDQSQQSAKHLRGRLSLNVGRRITTHHADAEEALEFSVDSDLDINKCVQNFVSETNVDAGAENESNGRHGEQELQLDDRTVSSDKLSDNDENSARDSPKLKKVSVVLKRLGVGQQCVSGDSLPCGGQQGAVSHQEEGENDDHDSPAEGCSGRDAETAAKPAEGPADKKQAERVLRLEKLLKKIAAEIKRLEETELSLSDMESEDTTYLLEDRYKQKFVKVWNKLCQLKGQKPYTGRETEKKLRYKGTQHEKLNQMLSHFVNKFRVFPDFADVRNVIVKCNTRHNLGIRAKDVDCLARSTFIDVGDILQKKRMRDFKQNLGCHFTDDIQPRSDPALSNADLRSKLEENRKICKVKLDEVFTKFATKQDTAKEQSSSESDEQTDKEEDDQPDKLSEEFDIDTDADLLKLAEKPDDAAPSATDNPVLDAVERVSHEMETLEESGTDVSSSVSRCSVNSVIGFVSQESISESSVADDCVPGLRSESQSSVISVEVSPVEGCVKALSKSDSQYSVIFIDTSPERNIRGSPGKNISGSPERNVSGSPERNISGAPERNIPRGEDERVPLGSETDVILPSHRECRPNRSDATLACHLLPRNAATTSTSRVRVIEAIIGSDAILKTISEKFDKNSREIVPCSTIAEKSNQIRDALTTNAEANDKKGSTASDAISDVGDDLVVISVEIPIKEMSIAVPCSSADNRTCVLQPSVDTSGTRLNAPDGAHRQNLPSDVTAAYTSICASTIETVIETDCIEIDDSEPTTVDLTNAIETPPVKYCDDRFSGGNKTAKCKASSSAIDLLPSKLSTAMVEALRRIGYDDTGIKASQCRLGSGAVVTTTSKIAQGGAAVLSASKANEFIMGASSEKFTSDPSSVQPNIAAKYFTVADPNKTTSSNIKISTAAQQICFCNRAKGCSPCIVVGDSTEPDCTVVECIEIDDCDIVPPPSTTDMAGHHATNIANQRSLVVLSNEIRSQLAASAAKASLTNGIHPPSTRTFTDVKTRERIAHVNTSKSVAVIDLESPETLLGACTSAKARGLETEGIETTFKEKSITQGHSVGSKASIIPPPYLRVIGQVLSFHK